MSSPQSAVIQRSHRSHRSHMYCTGPTQRPSFSNLLTFKGSISSPRLMIHSWAAHSMHTAHSTQHAHAPRLTMHHEIRSIWRLQWKISLVFGSFPYPLIWWTTTCQSCQVLELRCSVNLLSAMAVWLQGGNHASWWSCLEKRQMEVGRYKIVMLRKEWKEWREWRVNVT